MTIPRKQNGSIALLTVLALVIMLVSVGSALVISSTDYLISGRSFSERLTLDSIMRTCLEEGMYRLKKEKSFTGTVTYAQDSASCSIVISEENGDPNKRLIEIDAATDGYAQSGVFHADTTSKPYVVTK